MSSARSFSLSTSKADLVETVTKRILSPAPKDKRSSFMAAPPVMFVPHDSIHVTYVSCRSRPTSPTSSIDSLLSIEEWTDSPAPVQALPESASIEFSIIEADFTALIDDYSNLLSSNLPPMCSWVTRPLLRLPPHRIVAFIELPEPQVIALGARALELLLPERSQSRVPPRAEGRSQSFIFHRFRLIFS